MIGKLNFIFSLVILLLVSSCRSDDESPIVMVDIDAKRENILGDWIITSSTQWINATGNIGAQESTQLNISFYDDGTGLKSTDTSSVSFDWLYQYEPEKIIIQDSARVIFNPYSFNKNIIYSIQENEKDKQIWSAVLDDNPTGNWNMIKEKWELQRQ